MQAFGYSNPTTVHDAVGQLGSQWGEVDVLAGGTDLISLMKEYIHTPQRVVNIKNIKELRGIGKSAGGVRIGATVTLEELASNAEIKQMFPSLQQAAEGVTSPQMRNMGTVGGDLCQRPRCWYYRQGFGLLAMKDGKSLVPGGENKYHAILGNSGPAYFVSASSLGPALIALGAKVKLTSAKGHVRAETGGGGIELYGVPSARAETGAGTITVKLVNTGGERQDSDFESGNFEIGNLERPKPQPIPREKNKRTRIKRIQFTRIPDRIEL